MADKPTVAVVGASTNPEKYGNRSVKAHLRAGWTVYPVNPRADEIEGLHCYRNIRDVPKPVDRVTIYLPAKLGLEALEDIAFLEPKEFYVNPGAESPELLAKAKELGLEPIQACSIIDSRQLPT